MDALHPIILSLLPKKLESRNKKNHHRQWEYIYRISIKICIYPLIITTFKCKIKAVDKAFKKVSNAYIETNIRH